MASRITNEQAELVEQMGAWILENPNLPFEEIIRKYIGEFPKTTDGRAFARACKKVFDRERKSKA
jgi:hypothetical protein